MGRANRCNELISTEQRELLIELYTTTQKPYPELAKLTLISPEKIQMMTEGLTRPTITKKLSARKCTELLMAWR